MTPTPGQVLRDALAALGWHVLPWASMTPAERDGLESIAQAAAAGALLAAAGASADDAADAMTALTKVAEGHERVMYAAAIDIRLGNPGGAKHILGEQLDGYDGPEWDGTETGAQYLERARDGRAS